MLGALSPESTLWREAGHVEITEQLRGNISKTATVLAEDACYCWGPSWKTGAAYIVVGMPVAEQTAQIVADNQCGGTMITDCP